MPKFIIVILSIFITSQAFALGIKDFELAEPTPIKDIEYFDENNNSHNLNDLKGKVVLINFWATWCVPCIKEMPAIEQLSKNFEGREIEIIPLSVDFKGKDAVRDFYDEHKIEDLPIYVDKKGRGLKALGVKALPTTIIIDKEGREVARVLGEIDWTGDEVRKYLLAMIRE